MNKIEKVVRKLINFYGKDEAFPECSYLYGQKSVGKSLCIEKFLKEAKDYLQTVIIYADEIYTKNILFEIIINKFNEHVLCEENSYESYAKIDCMEDFLNELSALSSDKSYLIIIEKAEKMRDMDLNILQIFMKLQEFTGLNISCLFVSHLAFEKFGVEDMLKIYVPDYNKNDITEIFMTKYEDIHERIRVKIEDSNINDNMTQLEAFESMNEEFFKNYLNLFLNVFYKACRDLKELTFLLEKCYSSYYSPVLSGEIKANDVTNLWRHVSKHLKTSLNTIYMRVENDATNEFKNNENAEDGFEIEKKQSSIKSFAQTLELPFYAKYLLIASFLASHNDAKSDKKLFMKNHGKERRRRQQTKLSDKMNVQFGPKSFSIDRLLAIFYAILDEKVGLTCNLLSQISTLVDLNFLTYVSGENNIMEGTARLQSTIGLDFAINIGKLVGFNVKQYLVDFH
ncbi:unnamed protein product [Chironomus riparius]|uniref:Origin recognition complex subunit 5 n=1 Tax=Chironomus riparius TaxID=315576 RepID=A0A9N9S0X1_9DIPT|nr:unnamed protein product [Chironomus riparius]